MIHKNKLFFSKLDIAFLYLYTHLKLLSLESFQQSGKITYHGGHHDEED